MTNENHERTAGGTGTTGRRTFLKGTAAAVGTGALAAGGTASVAGNEGEAAESVPDAAEASERRGPHTGRPPTRSQRGMVATPHYLASAAGTDALRSGGSAVDAAIAANAVLSVAYPHMAGLGGDGFWLIHDGDDVRALNASGPAAADATRERYSGYDELPDRGPESAITVPGAVDGWRVAHDAYGALDWSDLFADAIHHAREGVPVGHSLADWLEIDEPILEHYPETASILLPGGERPEEGDRLVQSDLADSIETVATEGPRAGFYEGPLAEQLASPEGSPLSPADLAAFEAEWVDPISTTYRGHTAYNFPPNTQGFAALQVLNLLEGFDVESWGDDTADYYHHMAEAVKVAFADRDEWLTDPRFVDIPLDRLLDPSYLRERASLVDRERAMTMEDVDAGIAFGGDADRRSPGGDTCAFQAVDGDGLVVSVIQSIYHDFGTAVVGGDTGIILQN
ncbi:MAG: gamma-glutamyltransferase, partial [Halalkalicoccus sp.]